jgi:flagellar motility protein MotE (MotC chaperone)
MNTKKWCFNRSRCLVLILTLLFSLNHVISLAADAEPRKRRAPRGPTLAEQVKNAKEEAARADERARRAEEAAAAAQADANRAKSEAEELKRNITNVNGKMSDLEGKLNRALAALDEQQQKNTATERKVTDVATQVSTAQADVKKTQVDVEEVKKETKGAITSTNAKMSLYGFIVANTSFADRQLNISDIPVWAFARRGTLQPALVGGQAIPAALLAGNVRETIFTGRQSRFGFRASAPKVGDWTASGQFEFDFFGARPAAGQGSVFNQPRIRLGFVTLEHASGWKFVAGQDWVIFAPLNPTSYAHFAIPQAASAGNPWMRLPQIRVEKTIKHGEGTSLLLQGGVLRGVSGLDTPTAGTLADLPTLSGERSAHPFYQSRVALTTPLVAGKPLTLGLSGHYGREKPFNIIETWGLALDYTVPLHAKVGLTGELWTGSNLAPFQAGIAQGAVLIDNRPGRLFFRTIRAVGGWTQLAIAPTSKWTANLGYGQDAPKIRDLVAPNNRAKNQLWWANLMYKIHPNVTVALEYNYFDTIFKVPVTNPARVGTANYFNLAVVYGF